MPDASFSARERLGRTLSWLALSLVVIVLDQWTKSMAMAHLLYQPPYAVVPHFDLRLAFNQGAAFSFLADAGGWQRWLFAALAVVISAVLVAWIWRAPRGRIWLPCALALIAGGALGNLWDRVTLGFVVDFLDFYWGAAHFPAFNIADTGITVGAVMLGIDMLRHPE